MLSWLEKQSFTGTIMCMSKKWDEKLEHFAWICAIWIIKPRVPLLWTKKKGRGKNPLLLKTNRILSHTSCFWSKNYPTFQHTFKDSMLHVLKTTMKLSGWCGDSDWNRIGRIMKFLLRPVLGRVDNFFFQKHYPHFLDRYFCFDFFPLLSFQRECRSIQGR